MSPTIDLSNLTEEQMTAIVQMADLKLRMDQAKVKEPVDANVVPNPNLHRKLPYPGARYNHDTRETCIVKDAKEDAEMQAAGFIRDPFWPEEKKPVAKKGPGFDDENPDVSELRAQLAEAMAAIQDLKKHQPRGKRQGE